MNKIEQGLKLTSTSRRVKVVIVPLYFGEDPQLTPGRCWERRKKEQALNRL